MWLHLFCCWIQTITTDESGKFCWFATPGQYTLSAVVKDDEKALGLILEPASVTVSVTAEQVSRSVPSAAVVIVTR